MCINHVLNRSKDEISIETIEVETDKITYAQFDAYMTHYEKTVIPELSTEGFGIINTYILPEVVKGISIGKPDLISLGQTVGEKLRDDFVDGCNRIVNSESKDLIIKVP